MMKRGSLLAFLISLTLLSLAQGRRPLKTLFVSCHDRVYTVKNVSTVDELLQRIGRSTGREIDVNRNRVLFKGRIINAGDNLKDVGVVDGSHLMVFADDHRMKVKEVLALSLAMVSEDSWDRLRRELKEHPGALNDLYSKWSRTECMDSHDLYTFLRNGLDLSYHGLRAFWERPSFRSNLMDHGKIEAYRRVISFHLSPKIINDIPWMKKNVQSPARWRTEISKVIASFLRIGDIILDGILAMLLDVLKGNGNDASRTGTQSYPSTSKFTTSTFEDPESLIFELSESDSESDV